MKLKKGEVDILGDGIPPAQFNEEMADPANKDLIAAGDQLQTGYVTLNVTVPPFDNPKVRQAVNMAINKDRIVKLINNRAVTANQALPPAMPGYNPGNKGYPYDPDGAKKLLAEAGHPDGFTTELYTMNVDPNPRIAQAIQQDLAAVAGPLGGNLSPCRNCLGRCGHGRSDSDRAFLSRPLGNHGRRGSAG